MNYLQRFKDMCYEFDMLCTKENYFCWLNWLTLKTTITAQESEQYKTLWGV